MSGNPTWEAFAAAIDSELVLAQVLILRQGRGFELRHIDDRVAPANQLKLLAIAELRPLAQFTAKGAFRPLKSAPSLQAGWRAIVANVDELGFALQHLYPNALADWFAARQMPPPITNYREFTNRQTGMYRITQMLSDAQAGAMIRACCDAKVCLKRRLWSVNGLEIDATEEKSIIPCLEPCALLLEFARTIARLEQRNQPSEPQGVDASSLREADFAAAANPRRVLFEMAKRKMAATV